MSFRHIATFVVLLAVVIAAEGRPYDSPPELGAAKAEFRSDPDDFRKTLGMTIDESIGKIEQDYLRRTEDIKLLEEMNVERNMPDIDIKVPLANPNKIVVDGNTKLEMPKRMRNIEVLPEVVDGKDGNRNLMASYDIDASRLGASKVEFDLGLDHDDLTLTLDKTIKEPLDKADEAYLKKTEAIKLLEKMNLKQKMLETNIEVPFNNRYEIDLDAQGNTGVWPNVLNRNPVVSYNALPIASSGFNLY
ncbi:uncharacterized protein LOC144863917 [Branchiostoma floridae x Branchiostoma japonicum]